MKVKYLGLCGMAGSGKDYTREWLCDNSKHKVIRVAFADGVREEVTEILGIANPTRLFTKPYRKEVRWLLQQWGTELRRAEDPNHWVDYGMAKAERMASEFLQRMRVTDTEDKRDLLIVFTDVRFENEAAAITAKGGMVLEVRANVGLRQHRLGGTLPPDHASEEMDFFVDGYVSNNFNGFDPVFVGFEPGRLAVRDWLGLKWTVVDESLQE